MPSIRIQKELNSEMYFLTFTVINFNYLFDRFNRWQILAETLKYLIENKNLELYAFVFMINHVHLICQSNDMAAVSAISSLIHRIKLLKI